MFEQFIGSLKEWAEKNQYIESVVIVGSYARGMNKDTSDLDLVIITSNKAEMIATQEFAKYFGEIKKKQTEYYGACTSIRVCYIDGKEIEYGIVDPSWIAIPLDRGTQRVLSDGYKIVVDKNSNFQDLKL